MKKKVILSLLAGLLTVSLALSVSACGEEEKTENTPNQNQEQVEKPNNDKEQEGSQGGSQSGSQGVQSDDKQQEDSQGGSQSGSQGGQSDDKQQEGSQGGSQSGGPQDDVQGDEPGDEQEDTQSGEQGGEQSGEQGEKQDDEEEENAPVYLGMSIESVQEGVQQKDEIYHTRANTQVKIVVRFSNPEKYQISSFTLDGKSYADNMFEKESNAENIILKVSVGEFDGVKEYAIDAIKYLSGKKIKDVKIEGDKAVKLYRDYEISYHNTFDADLPTDLPKEYNMLSDVSFAKPTRTGYTFGGFFSDENFKNKVESIQKGSKGDMDLYVKWELVNYSITYELGGGKNAEENPESFTVEEEITFAPATRKGYVFIGWYQDKAYKEPFPVLKNRTGDLKLYACWEECTEGLIFQETEEGVSVKEYQGESKKVVIPQRYTGEKPVTAIGKEAFRGKEIESVQIPSGVCVIGEWAFASCLNLTSVIIPGSVREICEWAFYRCEALKSVTIENGVKTIGGSAFLNCKVLADVEIPDSVTEIGGGAFEYCESLITVEIPDSVTEIGEGTFKCCESLITVKIPDGVTEIGNSMFYFCTKLESVTMGNDVEKIGRQAFMECNVLKNFVLPSGVKEIGDEAFVDCRGFTSITIPSSVTTIGNRAFNRHGDTAKELKNLLKQTLSRA